ncbi:dolichol-phosphate mannosyltransferase subunit 3 [Rhizoclosmatium globosum]|uniref:Dolichol-phosphate mannosyltransferase subunit 3 n=1 Tax=Rhizoclosmatium globosum TaxID=329046 RepID=A0A1Y2CG53_9FUNG|nr:hypothetical protein HDU79_005690 [Rhizoclosmatium sp. JEL0117]ORY46038.1 dolichol-phosphate mannosyltransferase subunit 3 [Rhizoclosmatium globosum]|eukprot:ORY46038.1 dolichol-phosphate mannosyltransferase subunit 3 [Rhizoclosmatium globosum]
MGKRAQSILLVFAAGTAAWVLLMLHSVLIPFVPVPQYLDEIAPVLPLWLLVAFGAYSLASIGYALVTFGDCPEAYMSLLKEINEAKTDLKRRGVQID